MGAERWTAPFEAVRTAIWGRRPDRFPYRYNGQRTEGEPRHRPPEPVARLGRFRSARPRKSRLTKIKNCEGWDPHPSEVSKL